MEWKEYKKIEREMIRELRKKIKSHRKYMIEEFDDFTSYILMSVSMDLQHQVPIEKRKIAIAKIKAKEDAILGLREVNG